MNYEKQTLRKKETGLRIYDAIAKSGLSYEIIADRLELASSRVLYEWTSGNKMPSLENLINLSLMLNVKLESLLYWS